MLNLLAENQNTIKRYTEAVLEVSEKISKEVSAEKVKYMHLVSLPECKIKL
jgi:hypothetical protein